MRMTFLTSQLRPTPDAPLPYTASPWNLLWEDIRLLFRCLPLLPKIVFPVSPCNSGKLNEMYPSMGNIGSFIIHVVLILLQLLFLISLPVCIACMVPALWISLYTGLVLVLNQIICDLLLNRRGGVLVSQVPEREAPGHKREHWIFINGVGVGKSWLQNSLDRLGYTFGRKVTGVHNPTSGMVFDIIQVLIQRNFCYSTQDVRDAYAIAKADLLSPQYTKVVLIAHSQGGIEASLIIDWLLDEIPQELLRKLEVYTFGNAANHFNNPYSDPPRTFSGLPSQLGPASQSAPKQNNNMILHIEHYANSEDFVSAWGVLNFTSIPNRYMGRVFVRPGTGHQFVQHCMDTMFTFSPGRNVLDSNDFMDMDVEVPDSVRQYAQDIEKEEKGDEFVKTETKKPPRSERIDSGRPLTAGTNLARSLKVKDLSRLWQYRNGGSPTDFENQNIEPLLTFLS